MARRKRRKPARLSLWSWFVKFLSWLAILLFFVLGVCLILWSLGPRLWAFSSSKNIIFNLAKKDGLENKYYLAEYKKLTRGDSFTISPLKLESGSPAFESKLTASWSLDLVIDQLVALSTTEDLRDYSQLIRAVRAEVWHDFFNQDQFLWSLCRLFFTLRSLDSVQVEFAREYQPNLLTLAETDNCTLAVINTTQQAGLATQVAHLLEKSGARVVRIADQAEAEPVSSLIFSQDSAVSSCPLWAARIQALFPEPATERDEPAIRQRQRAQLVILLGEDLATAQANWFWSHD